MTLQGNFVTARRGTRAGAHVLEAVTAHPVTRVAVEDAALAALQTRRDATSLSTFLRAIHAENASVANRDALAKRVLGY